MRLFVALEVPAPAREAVEARLGPLRGRFPFAWSRLVTHLTLAFLGETPPDRAAALPPRLAAACRGHPPLRLQLQSAGTFGHPPRVLWLGVAGDLEAARALQRAVAEAVELHDETPWTPHLTLARSKGQRGDPRLRDAAALLEGEAWPALEVREVTLFESRAGQHLALARFPLGE